MIIYIYIGKIGNLASVPVEISVTDILFSVSRFVLKMVIYIGAKYPWKARFILNRNTWITNFIYEPQQDQYTM
jgi:hypothetical protein